MRTTVTCLAAAFLVVSVACNHESRPVRPVTTTGAGVVANDDAVRQLTSAYCERAKDCNYFGPKERYADEAACQRERHHDLQADLRPGECPRGIKAEKLNDCLQEIRNHKCGNVIDHLSRIATCRTGALCLD